MIAVAFALIVTGTVSAALGGAPRAPAVLRNVGVGLLTMGITFGTGVLVGAIL
jgi:VIT1/CCC1 family predicted Fe2+/Mn2+ transporter